MTAVVHRLVGRLLETDADGNAWAYRGIDFKQFKAIRKTGNMYPSHSCTAASMGTDPDLRAVLNMPEGPLIWFSSVEDEARTYGSVMVRFPWPEDAHQLTSDGASVVTHRIPATSIEVLTDTSGVWVPILDAKLLRGDLIGDPEP